MSHINVPLIESMIRPKLGEYADGTVNYTIKGRAYHYKFTKGNKPVLLIIHPKNKGLFTLQAAGQNQDLANEAADYLVENATATTAKDFSLSLHGYTKEKLDILIGYLCDECGAVADEPVEISHGQSTKVTGKQRDALTFNLYNTGTLTIQGRPVVLAIELVQFLSEDAAISQDDLLKYVGTIFSTPVTAAAANKQLTNEYPYAYAFAGDNLTKQLGTAISMRGLPMEVEDYSVISFPALRALEGFMRKAVLVSCGEYWEKFDSFYTARQAPLSMKLNADTKSRISCETTCSLLEECYTYFKPHRHGTFHASGVDEEIRVISNRAEAIGISSNCLDLINNYSKLLCEKNEVLQSKKN